MVPGAGKAGPRQGVRLAVWEEAIPLAHRRNRRAFPPSNQCVRRLRCTGVSGCNPQISEYAEAALRKGPGDSGETADNRGVHAGRIARFCRAWRWA